MSIETILPQPAALTAKDFATADALRDELQSLGYVVETSKDGTRIRRG